jgi:DNA-binding transcriptional MerR regulator
MQYTVKQLSMLAGVTPRTLRHYHKLGLLKPEAVGVNRYRYYGDESVLHLQQILFYRELDFPLEQIKRIINHPGFDLLTALEEHRRALEQRVEHTSRLIQAVDDTILHLKGKKEMSKKQLFEAFSDEQQEEYARQAEQMYDAETVHASNRKWKAYSAEEKKRILEEGSRIYTDLIALIPQGPGNPEVQACIERWRKHMDYFWTPKLEQLQGLADLYNNSPDFKANFDKMDPRLATFMHEAVEIYVKRQME